MDKRLLMGLWRLALPIPPQLWNKQIEGEGGPESFLTETHHRVRDFVVTELPRAGKPLSPESIAAALDLPLNQVIDILAELERHKTYLFRDEQGAVQWAYPVTAEPTPHHVTFSTGEQIYAA